MMTSASPDAVARAFGVQADVTPLAGGEGLSFRAGPVVIKRVHDEAEAAWVQDLLARIDMHGFRIASPIPTRDRSWTFDGWSASEFIAGLEPLAPSWHLIIESGLAFGAAADEVVSGTTSVLDARTHRWAIADRVAWGEVAASLEGEAAEIHRQLVQMSTSEPGLERRFVHGDLAGNVFVDPAGCPVILDVSPYLRHPRWAAAIVVGDAVLWHGANMALARRFAADPYDRGLLGRALRDCCRFG